MSIASLLDGIAVTAIVGNQNIVVTSIEFDSRAVTEGCLFVAITGLNTDGHQYIESAIENGAVGIVCQELPSSINASIGYIQVDDSSVALAKLAAHFYEQPSQQLTLVGVTGTNGKTTVATTLYLLFRALGYKVGLISTIRNYVDDKEIPSQFTTPDVLKINWMLDQMVEQGCEYCFMEVSSHGLAMNRVEGLHFAGGIFTNITHDHLDFHGTFTEYLKVKKSFFDNLPSTAFALTNLDDRNGQVMLQNTVAEKKSYALKSLTDYRCKILESHFDGMLLQVNSHEVWTRFTGHFNAYNLLAGYAKSLLLG